jgi:hypothetical protein
LHRYFLKFVNIETDNSDTLFEWVAKDKNYLKVL